MAEIAERRGAEAGRAEDERERARIELRALRKVRAVEDEREHRRRRRGDRRHAEHHLVRRQRPAESLQEVREGGAEHQRADEKPERVAEVAAVPAGGARMPTG